MLSMRSPRQTAVTGVSNGGGSGIAPGNAWAGSTEGSGPKILLHGKADDVQGEEVVGNAHPGHRRREIIPRVVLPRLPHKAPEFGEELLVGAPFTAGAIPLDARLGHAHQHLGAPPRPHREHGYVQVAAYPQ